MGKVDEELAEAKAAIAAGDRSQLAEELGDLLCAVVMLCRWHHLEAEELMHQAVGKFCRRFRYMEQHAGKPLGDLTTEQWRRLWDEGKRE